MQRGGQQWIGVLFALFLSPCAVASPLPLTIAAAVKTAFIHALVSANVVTIAQQGSDAIAQLSTEVSQKAHLSDAERMNLNAVQIQESRARRELAAAQRAHDATVTTLRRLLGL